MAKKSKKRANKGSTWDLVTLILSLAAGMLWSLVGQILLSLLDRSPLPSVLRRTVYFPVQIGLFFLGLSLALILVAGLCMRIKGGVTPRGKDYRNAILLSLVVFLVAGAFQFLYMQDFKTDTEELHRDSSFVFLIDDSGSMAYMDSNNERAKAITECMEKQSPMLRYAVYAFDSSVRLLSDMHTASEADSAALVFSSYGGTNTIAAIKSVLEDIEDGRLNAGAHPHIILFTDGDPDDSRSNTSLNRANLTNKAKTLGVRFSIIGLGDLDKSFFEDFATKTGGQSLSVNDIEELSSALTQVVDTEASAEYTRTLLNIRPQGLNNDWFYGVIRVAALVSLGVVFFVIKSLLLRTNDQSATILVLIINIAMVGIGALCVEFGLNVFFWPQVLMLLLLCIGFTILIVKQRVVKYNSTSNHDTDSYGHYSFSSSVESDGNDSDDDFDYVF